MSASEPRRRTELTEDGELFEVSSTPADRLSAVYCTNCGSANKPHSSFCRTCGASLDEQTLEEDYPLSRPKLKRSERRRESTSGPSMPMSAMVPLEIFTMFFVAGMVIATAAFSHSAFLPVCILIAWFMVVAARHGALSK